MRLHHFYRVGKGQAKDAVQPGALMTRPNANISNLTHSNSVSSLIHFATQIVLQSAPRPTQSQKIDQRGRARKRESAANQTTKVNKERYKNGNNIGKNQFSI